MVEIRRTRGRIAISSNLTWCGRQTSLSCGSVGKQRVDWEEPDKKVHHRDEWVVKTHCGLSSGIQRNTISGKNETICTCSFLRMSFHTSFSCNNITSNRFSLCHQVSPYIAMWCLCCGRITGLDGKQSLGHMKERNGKKTIKCKFINRKRSSVQEEGRNRPTEPETRGS